MTTFMSLKLIVDKRKNRVVFAEADEDFVDTICSFLTLPLGTVVRILGKQSMLGCMDNLYQSVENLNTKYLQTEACKKMLLEPRSASEILCEDLKLNVDDLKPRRIYRCPTFECFTKTHRLYSPISGTRCPCGEAMDKSFEWIKEKVAHGVLFVKGGKRFLIRDDFNIMPLLSMETALSLFKKYGVKDMKNIGIMTVKITRNKILMLLKRLLVSKTPLTDVFLLELDSLDKGDSDEASRKPMLPTIASKTIRIKLLYNRVSKKVLCAQAEEEFADILFSFLTFPLGLIVKLLDKHSSIGCLDNLYKSIELSDGGWDYIKSEERRNLLLAPKIFRHFGCSKQLLRIEEKLSRKCWVHGCQSCWNEGIAVPTRMCKHDVAVVSLSQVNPKLSSSGIKGGGGYAMKSVCFMVTDEMEVTSLTSVSGINVIKKSKSAINSLVEKEVSLGEVEVLHLLKACLISRTPLSNVFSSSLSKTGLGLEGKDFCVQTFLEEEAKEKKNSGILPTRRLTWSNLKHRFGTFLMRKKSASLDSEVEFAIALALSSPKILGNNINFNRK